MLPDVHYQPIVDLRSGAVIAAEALLRPVTPAIVAHLEAGLHPDLQTHLLEQAEHTRSNLDLPISVNVGPAQLSTRLVRRLAAGGLTLELTERGPLTATALALLNAAQAEGVPVVLDDFGTGGRDLADLADAPATGIKIDQRFVADVPTSYVGRGIVASLLHLAAALALDVTAEGVETAAQRQVLLALGATAAQGTYFAPAMTSTALGARVGRFSRTYAAVPHRPTPP